MTVIELIEVAKEHLDSGATGVMVRGHGSHGSYHISSTALAESGPSNLYALLNVKPLPAKGDHAYTSVMDLEHFIDILDRVTNDGAINMNVKMRDESIGDNVPDCLMFIIGVTAIDLERDGAKAPDLVLDVIDAASVPVNDTVLQATWFTDASPVHDLLGINIKECYDE